MLHKTQSFISRNLNNELATLAIPLLTTTTITTKLNTTQQQDLPPKQQPKIPIFNPYTNLSQITDKLQDLYPLTTQRPASNSMLLNSNRY